ncbi:MAG: hypothetical protein KDC45_09880 [Bacteroidetes bacterium]|nr:hypothetical protein [Bacteroidota bacterium]
MSRFIFAVVVCVFCPMLGRAQNDLRSSVSQLTSSFAKGYISPVASGMGTSMNTGWFHRTPPAKKLGFHFEMGVIAMGSTFGSKDRKFTANGDLRLDSLQAAKITGFVYTSNEFSHLTLSQKQEVQAALIDQIIGSAVRVRMSGPTAIGSKNDSLHIAYTGAVISYTDPVTNQTLDVDLAAQGEESVLPVRGLELPLVGWFAWQTTIGTLAGTYFTFRFFPPRNSGALGKLTYFGWGLQHNPAVWMERKWPVDLSILLFSQRLKQGRFFEMKTTAFGFTAGKQVGWQWLHVYPYAGVMVESSTINVQYDYTNSTGQLEKTGFDLKGDNRARITIGSSFRFLVANVNLDYSLAKYPSYSVGLTLAF